MDHFFSYSFSKRVKRVFKLFSVIYSKNISQNLDKLAVILGLIIQRLNLYSLVVFNASNIKNFSVNGYIPLILGKLRLDAFYIQQNSQFSFSVLVFVLVFLNAFAKLAIFIQFYCKKKHMTTVLIILSRLTS